MFSNSEKKLLICNRNETCKKEDNRRQSSIRRNENLARLIYF